ncbi:hypothetical protein I5M84_14100 [Pseudomonas aeruginosa]|nr:hypothetical protein [Pseudomonas aeruginosa]
MSMELNKALDLLREIRPSIPKEVLELWCKDRDAFLASHPAVEQAGGDERAVDGKPRATKCPDCGEGDLMPGDLCACGYETDPAAGYACSECDGSGDGYVGEVCRECDGSGWFVTPEQARAALAHAPTSSASPSCKWTESSGIWETGCGQTWSFIEDGPAENGALFCHHCGGRLDLIKSDDQEDDGEPCPECMEHGCNGECAGHGAMGD